MGTHTPGPWGFSDDAILCGEPDTAVGSVFPMDRDGTRYAYGDVTQANGRLIAAAPELLEALREIADVTTPGDGVPNIEWLHGRALAAIAKATGEQP